MSNLQKLPDELVEQIAVVTAKIGPERAIILLQGLLHKDYPLTIIDGVVRPELHKAVEHVLKTNEIEAITVLYKERVEARFPGTFEAEESEEAEEAPVEAVATKTTRRVR